MEGCYRPEAARSHAGQRTQPEPDPLYRHVLDRRIAAIVGGRNLLSDRRLAQEDAGWCHHRSACFSSFRFTYLTSVANFLSSFEGNRYRFQMDGFFLVLFGMALEQARQGLSDKRQPSDWKPAEFTRRRRGYWERGESSLAHA